jgi:DNA-binding PadR family transcriptional regulator
MKPEPFLTGQIDLLLLSIVSRGPIHGYAIIEALRSRSGGVFELREGTVYPALYRLERLGLLASDVQPVSGRPRRNYRLTRSGAVALRARRAAWDAIVRSVGAVLAGRRAVARG